MYFIYYSAPPSSEIPSLTEFTMGMFADRKFIEKNSFKLEKLKRPVKVRNVNETGNSGGLVTHEIKVNVYYQGHMKRMKLDVCHLGRTKVILGML